jgi:hypothetical protein
MIRPLRSSTDPRLASNRPGRTIDCIHWLAADRRSENSRNVKVYPMVRPAFICHR